MNDEQKRVVRLLREYDGVETGFERKRNELEAAELITHILDEFDRAIAENERIRQTHVTHEAYKMVLDELEQVKRDRDAALDAALRIARLLPEVCGEECSGDSSVGIHDCPAYQSPDMLDDGTIVLGGCMGLLVGGGIDYANKG